MDTLLELAWIPLVGALIGYLTNVLAIRMLFRPRRPLRILGLTIHGLIPRRRRELALAVGRTVAEHLVTPEDIRRVLASQEVQAAFTRTLEEHVGRLLRERLLRSNPVVQRVFNERVLAALQRALTGEVMRVVPGLLDLFTERLEQYVSIKDIVVERLERFEEERIEAIVRGVAQRELTAIEVLGGLLGLIVGLIQFVIVALVVT